MGLKKNNGKRYSTYKSGTSRYIKHVEPSDHRTNNCIYNDSSYEKNKGHNMSFIDHTHYGD